MHIKLKNCVGYVLSQPPIQHTKSPFNDASGHFVRFVEELLLAGLGFKVGSHQEGWASIAAIPK